MKITFKLTSYLQTSPKPSTALTIIFLWKCYSTKRVLMNLDGREEWLKLNGIKLAGLGQFKIRCIGRGTFYIKYRLGWARLGLNKIIGLGFPDQVEDRAGHRHVNPSRALTLSNFRWTFKTVRTAFIRFQTVQYFRAVLFGPDFLFTGPVHLSRPV